MTSSGDAIEVSPLPPPKRNGLKVLIADDDPRALEFLAIRIAGLATTILLAHGGRDAIDTARKELPDLVILDLVMPEVNGFDVVMALSERADTARIPILVLTAKQITAEDREQLGRYATTVIDKTQFDTGRFAAEIRRAVTGGPHVSANARTPIDQSFTEYPSDVA